MRAEAPRPSLVRGARLVIATHNPGKLTEIAALLAPHGLELLSAGGLGLPEPEETAESFAGNAALKAHAIAAGAGLPALADDSGLCVAALDGAPGIHSARWAGPRRNFSVAMKRVRDALQAREAEAGERDRRAAFVCALCLAWPDGREACFEGRVEGSIVWPPRGTRGFGYDPIFLPEGRDQTFGEMDPAEKHAMSHRARAFAQFSQALLGAAP